MPIQLCAQLPQAAGTVSPIWMEQKMLKQKLWLWAATWHAYCGWILNSSLLIFNETPSRCYYYYCFLYEFFLLYLARQAVSQDAFINSLDVTIFTLIYKRCAVDGGPHDFTVVVTWLFVFWFFFFFAPHFISKNAAFPQCGSPKNSISFFWLSNLTCVNYCKYFYICWCARTFVGLQKIFPRYSQSLMRKVVQRLASYYCFMQADE